ncbi:MAG: PQQ-dependent sugar dehydrogenase [Pseudomonadota bacterium]
MKASRFLLCLGVLAAVSLAGCGGGSDTAQTPATPAPAPTPPPAAGLDARPANASCLAPARSGGSTGVVASRAFPSLSFASPVALLQAPGDPARWFVVEQGGVVRRFVNSDSSTSSAVFVDLSGRVTFSGEAGLLGLAFHPQFPTDPRAFVFYSTGSSPLTTRIAELRSTDAGQTLDPASERILLTITKPESNHNGGHLAFGPDGFLYAGVGDGGGGGDMHGTIGNGQNMDTLLGKMLRIDVNATPPAGRRYAIPAGNTFASGQFCSDGGTATPGNRCAEIYASGLRNPWRFSFDRQGGTLWVADVGQGNWEEVNRVTSGGNYGWRCREGAHAFSSNCGGATGLIDPVAEYSHAEGSSITGGFVYRGTANPQLVGRYVVGDFGSGRIWSIAADAAPTVTLTSGTDTGLNIASFGEGVDGELYAVHYGGTLHRLMQATGATANVASQLSQTGCVSASAPTTPATGLIPYAPNAAFWSDGALKERFLALPDGQNIVVTADGDFDFPNGSVLVKNFRIGTQLVETRLFMRHPDGVWAGYSYEWNAAGTDATRVVGGKTVSVAGQSWTYPSEAQCLQCHTSAAGHTLGLAIDQLNGTLTYPATARSANQITTLNAIGTLSPPVTQDPANLARLPDPAGTVATVAERARAYLHVNCANCHRPGGGTPDTMDLRYTTALPLTNACNAAPAAGDLGITGARLLMPGSAAQSLIVARMNRRTAGAMPPLASNIVDAAGVALLTSWVNSLTSCN